MNLVAKLDVEVPPDYVEAYHWIKSNADLENVVIKMWRHKDADKIPRTKN